MKRNDSIYIVMSVWHPDPVAAFTRKSELDKWILDHDMRSFKIFRIRQALSDEQDITEITEGECSKFPK